MAIRARNNTVIVRPTYEPMMRLSQFASMGEEIETKEFGKVKVHGTKDYVNTAAGNNIAWGEVLDVGPGAAWMNGRYRMDKVLKRGDIIGFDQCQEVSMTFEGKPIFFLPVNAALCRFNASDELPAPLGAYILTKEEPGATESIMFSSAAGRRFVLPRAQATGEIKVSDSAWSKVKFTVERVLGVGTGGVALSEKFKELVHIHPDPEAIGKLAMFMFTMSVDVQVHGVRHRLTNWDRVRALVEA